MDRLTNLLTLLAAAIAVVTMLWIGAPEQPVWWRNAIGPAAWALTPYAAMWLLNNVIVAEQRQRDLILLLTIAAMLLLECVQIAVVISAQDQSGLAAMLQRLPLLQLLLVSIGGGLAFFWPLLRPLLGRQHRTD